MGVIRTHPLGASGTWLRTIPINNVAPDGINRADAHSASVRIIKLRP
jgi:hypothetical protein